MTPFLLSLLLGTTPPPDFTFNDPDSLRVEVAALVSQGKLDEAMALVEGLAPTLAPSTANALRGRIDWKGESSRKALELAVSDGSDSAARGEALFLSG